MHQPLVSVIIVNWNGLQFLKRCLTTLTEQNYHNFEIIIVDNGSTDGSVRFIRETCPDVSVVENSDNRGFAAANNQGIGKAGGRYLVLLNNDTEVDSEWLHNLVTAAEASPPDVGMWACKILSLEDRETIDSVGGLLISRCGIAKGRGRGERDRGQYDNEREVFIPSACASMYRKEMVDAVGGFDEEFFAYCEDTDLGVRARLQGWKTRSVPDAVVYHHYSGTAGKYSPMKAFLVERNHMWVVIKNFPLPLVMSFPFFTVWRYVLQGYAVVAGRGAGGRYAGDYSRISLARLLGKAWLGVARGIPGMVIKRRGVQSSRVVSGNEVRKWFSRYRIGTGDLVFRE